VPVVFFSELDGFGLVDAVRCTHPQINPFRRYQNLFGNRYSFMNAQLKAPIRYITLPILAIVPLRCAPWLLPAIDVLM